MQPIAKTVSSSLKATAVLIGRKSLLTTAAVVSLAALSAIGATIYVRQAPALATAADVTETLVARPTASVQSGGQSSALAPIAQAVNRATPEPAPEDASPVALLPTPVRDVVAEPGPINSVANVAEDTSPPTAAPGDAPATSFIPTVATTRPARVNRQRKAVYLMCK